MDPLILLFLTVAGTALTGSFVAVLYLVRDMPPKPRIRRSPTQ